MGSGAPQNSTSMVASAPSIRKRCLLSLLTLGGPCTVTTTASLLGVGIRMVANYMKSCNTHLLLAIWLVTSQ